LEFEYTNIIEKYESLIMVLDTTRKMGIKILNIFGYINLEPSEGNKPDQTPKAKEIQA
jgi:hypothetical protein